MLGDCCTTWFSIGESVCPVCHGQLKEHQVEVNEACRFQPRLNDLKHSARSVLERGIVRPQEVGLASPPIRSLARRNPARAEIFRRLGFYLREDEARGVLMLLKEAGQLRPPEHEQFVEPETGKDSGGTGFLSQPGLATVISLTRRCHDLVTGEKTEDRA